MKIKTTISDSLLRLYFEGELDHHAAKTVMRDIEDAIDRHLPRDLLLDMSGLTFMDSSGIAVVLKAYRRMNEIGGRTRVANVHDQPRRVFDASGIERIIPISSLVKEA